MEENIKPLVVGFLPNFLSDFGSSVTELFKAFENVQLFILQLNELERQIKDIPFDLLIFPLDIYRDKEFHDFLNRNTTAQINFYTTASLTAGGFNAVLHDIIFKYKESLKNLTIPPKKQELIKGTSGIISDISLINRNWLEIIRNSPEHLYEMNPREFEEFMADLFIKLGYEVTLSPATRDGGKDIYAMKKDFGAEFLYAVECKKYSRENKVGRPTLQHLYGVVESEKLTGGIVATTSFFSKDSIEFLISKELQHRLVLQDFYDLKDLVSKI